MSVTAPVAAVVTAPAPAVSPLRSARGRAGAAVAGYGELLRSVQAAGLLRRRRGWYAARFTAVGVGLAGVAVGVGVVGDSWWQLLLAAALAVVLTQVAFLGHDTCHRQVFASHAVNEWVSRVLSALIGGLSYGWWMSKHTRHHSGPNQEDRDPDIAPGWWRSPPRWPRRSGA